jgi:hypothetical protein
VYILYKKDKKDINQCDDGFYGSKCQYSNVITCNNRGKVSLDDNDNYVCKCSGNYTGKNCEKCKPGYIGSKCQYNNFYCNNNGSVRVDIYDKPTCDCYSNLGWRGSKCQFNDTLNEQNLSPRCNNKGYYNTETQSCNCLPGYYGTGSCSYSDSYCTKNGYISDLDENPDPPKITCTCNKGFAGSKCQYNENVLCNGKGTLSVDSADMYTCNCSGNYTGKNCERCKTGFFGEKDNCKYSNETTCNGGSVVLTENPTPQPSMTPNPIYKIECACYQGSTVDVKKTGKKSGSRCQIDDNLVCNNRGYISRIIDENSNPPNVECNCLDQYEGKYCERCKAGYSCL